MGWAMAKIENGRYTHLWYEDCIVGFSLYLNPSSKMSYKIKKGIAGTFCVKLLHIAGVFCTFAIQFT